MPGDYRKRFLRCCLLGGLLVEFLLRSTLAETDLKNCILFIKTADFNHDGHLDMTEFLFLVKEYSNLFTVVPVCGTKELSSTKFDQFMGLASCPCNQRYPASSDCCVDVKAAEKNPDDLFDCERIYLKRVCDQAITLADELSCSGRLLKVSPSSLATDMSSGVPPTLSIAPPTKLPSVLPSLAPPTTLPSVSPVNEPTETPVVVTLSPMRSSPVVILTTTGVPSSVSPVTLSPMRNPTIQKPVRRPLIQKNTKSPIVTKSPVSQAASTQQPSHLPFVEAGTPTTLPECTTAMTKADVDGNKGLSKAEYTTFLQLLGNCPVLTLNSQMKSAFLTLVARCCKLSDPFSLFIVEVDISAVYVPTASRSYQQTADIKTICETSYYVLPFNCVPLPTQSPVVDPVKPPYNLNPLPVPSARPHQAPVKPPTVVKPAPTPLPGPLAPATLQPKSAPPAVPRAPVTAPSSSQPAERDAPLPFSSHPTERGAPVLVPSKPAPPPISGPRAPMSVPSSSQPAGRVAPFPLQLSSQPTGAPSQFSSQPTERGAPVLVPSKPAHVPMSGPRAPMAVPTSLQPAGRDAPLPLQFSSQPTESPLQFSSQPTGAPLQFSSQPTGRGAPVWESSKPAPSPMHGPLAPLAVPSSTQPAGRVAPLSLQFSSQPTGRGAPMLGSSKPAPTQISGPLAPLAVPSSSQPSERVAPLQLSSQPTGRGAPVLKPFKPAPTPLARPRAPMAMSSSSQPAGRDAPLLLQFSSQPSGRGVPVLVPSKPAPTPMSGPRAPLAVPSITSTAGPQGLVLLPTSSEPSLTPTAEPWVSKASFAPALVPSNNVVPTTCTSNMVTADKNFDALLSRDEYLQFIVSLSKCKLITDLTPAQSKTFTFLACKCKELINADQNCCLARNARVSIEGANIPNTVRFIDQTNALLVVCLATENVTSDVCTVSPTTSSPTSSLTGATRSPAAASGTTRSPMAGQTILPAAPTVVRSPSAGQTISPAGALITRSPTAGQTMLPAAVIVVTRSPTAGHTRSPSEVLVTTRSPTVGQKGSPLAAPFKKRLPPTATVIDGAPTLFPFMTPANTSPLTVRAPAVNLSPSSCILALKRSDKNLDGYLSEVEFLDFIQLYSMCDLTTNLSPEQFYIFQELACTCLNDNKTNKLDCCLRGNARVFLGGANVTYQTYLAEVCSKIDTTFGEQCAASQTFVPLVSVNLDRCSGDLLKTDINGDGSLDKNEFLSFIQRDGPSAITKLDLGQEATFQTLSCGCMSRPGATYECCLPGKASLNVSGAGLPGINRTSEESTTLAKICIATNGLTERTFVEPSTIAPLGDDCLAALVTADANSDDMIDIQEYLAFIQQGYDKCSGIQQLSFTQQLVFNMLACSCLSKPGAQLGCCFPLKNAKIDIYGARLNELSRTPDQTRFLSNICRSSNATVDVGCQAFPPTSAPASAYPLSKRLISGSRQGQPIASGILFSLLGSFIGVLFCTG